MLSDSSSPMDGRWSTVRLSSTRLKRRVVRDQVDRGLQVSDFDFTKPKPQMSEEHIQPQRFPRNIKEPQRLTSMDMGFNGRP